MNKKTGLYILLTLALLISAGLSMGLGAVQIPLKEVVVILGKKIGLFSEIPVSIQHEGVLNIVRIPRVILGVLVGAA